MGNILFNISNFLTNNLRLPEPSSIFSNFGEKLLNVLSWLGEAAMLLVYFVSKFILNIVDFLQYFCQKLIGLDAWGKESGFTMTDIDKMTDKERGDLIFRFMYNDDVQKVFRYMVGIFIILLIFFRNWKIRENYSLILLSEL